MENNNHPDVEALAEKEDSVSVEKSILERAEITCILMIREFVSKNSEQETATDDELVSIYTDEFNIGMDMFRKGFQRATAATSASAMVKVEEVVKLIEAWNNDTAITIAELVFNIRSLTNSK